MQHLFLFSIVDYFLICIGNWLFINHSLNGYCFLLQKELRELYQYRDLFFENHHLDLANDKDKFVDEKKDVLLEKFENIDGKYILCFEFNL